MIASRADMHAERQLEKMLDEVHHLINTPQPEHGHDFAALMGAIRDYVQAEVKHTLGDLCS
jgi:hypothetical protein